MSKKFKTLITADFDLSYLEPIKDKLEIETAGYIVNKEILEPSDLIEKIRDKDILISEYETVSKEIIESAPNLKFIGCCRGGVGTAVDIEVATEKDIIVVSTPGRNANAVADFIMGLLLDITRNITKANNLIKNRIITSDISSKPGHYKDTVWGMDDNSPFVKYSGVSLTGKKLGIIGFGKIGGLLAKKADCFGLDILVYDPYIKSESIKDLDIEITGLDELYKQSDFITLCCALTKDTKGMISQEAFSKMKNSAYIINTGRGALINEEDLYKALKSKIIAGAALDVLTVEPISPDNPLLDLESIILTPHLAGASDEVKKETSQMMAERLKGFLIHKIPNNVVNPEVFYN